jgi:hypothetical protein
MTKIVNPLHVAEGYVNVARKGLGIANTEIEHLAELREKICRTKCDQSRGEAGATAFSEETGRCTICNCKMAAKWRAMNETCPKQLW